MSKKPKYLPLIIAIDGPAASGKGSVGRKLAKHLGYVYLDTGKLYRLVGWKALQEGLDMEAMRDVHSQEAGKAAFLASAIKINEINAPNLSLEEVGNAASVVSAIPGVRQALLAFQREVAASPKGAVLDGRDIGTVVCPGADFKFYITAAVETRAERRFKELQKQDDTVIYRSVLQDLQRRDERDRTRAMSPLKPAQDAIRIDTTAMNLEEVFKKVLSMVLSKAAPRKNT